MRKEAYLVAFTSSGNVYKHLSVYERLMFPNKTQAIREGRFLKENGYAVSYKVYQRNGQGKLVITANG